MSSSPESVETVDDLTARFERDLTAALGIPTTARIERVTDRGDRIRVRFVIRPDAASLVERLRGADPDFYRDVNLEARGQFDVRCTVTR